MTTGFIKKLISLSYAISMEFLSLRHRCLSCETPLEVRRDNVALTVMARCVAMT